MTVFLLLGNGEITASAAPAAETSSPAMTDTKGQMPARATELPRFSGERAMADVVKQVQGGPRLPNSAGLQVTRQLITSELAAAGWAVCTQDFEAFSPLLGQTVPGQNIFAIYPKETTATCVISAHYDTRPFADMDPDPARRQEPVPGANDGGSGVAVLLELGRLIPRSQVQGSVALVFFDLEDHGAAGNNNGFCLGSRYFASNLPTQVKDFQWGINLDMVGGTDLKLPMEGFSLSKAPRLTFDLWKVGKAFYPQIWTTERGPMIYDDHMPFLAIGKQYTDVIDIRYPQWHTTTDIPENCSSQSLEAVGDTVLRFILNSNHQP
jgi:hypothetical protein